MSKELKGRQEKERREIKKKQKSKRENKMAELNSNIKVIILNVHLILYVIL